MCQYLPFDLGHTPTDSGQFEVWSRAGPIGGGLHHADNRPLPVAEQFPIGQPDRVEFGPAGLFIEPGKFPARTKAAHRGALVTKTPGADREPADVL